MSSDVTIIENAPGNIGTPPDSVERTLIEPATNSDKTIIEVQVPGVPGTTILETPATGSASGGLLLAPGATFLDYRLERPLEIASGEAELWLIVHQNTGDNAVLKLYHRGMKPKADVAEAVSTLDTLHVVRVFTRGRTDEAYPRHYEIMEYVVHGSLADMMKVGPLHPSVIRDVLRELSEALECLHGANIFHRDVKPSNILVRSVNPLDLVLTDFGISSVSDLSRHLTSANRTASYSAPEAITGVLSRTCDWWSLGVIVLEMLTGHHPFDGLNEATINYELVTRGIRVPPDLPAEWRQVAMGLLTKNDVKRWAGKEVTAWLHGQTDQAVSYVFDDEASLAAKAKQQQARAPSFRPYEFQKTEYFDKESLALVLGRAENWDDAVKRVGRGFIGRWLKTFETEDVVNAVLDIEEDEALNADQKLAAMLLVMNPQVPLIWKGEVVTPDWLADHQETATALLKSTLPAWIKRIKNDPWLVEVRDRRDRILEELKPFLANLPLDKKLARELTLIPNARLEQLAGTRWRSLAAAKDASLQTILNKTEMTEAEAIVLLTCDQIRFTTRQQAWLAYMDAAVRKLDDLRTRARGSANLGDMAPLTQLLTQITQETEAEYLSHAQRTDIARNDSALQQHLTHCQQEIARIPQRAWDAALTTANTKLKALYNRVSARPTSFAGMQAQQTSLEAIRNALNASYQECAKYTEIVRNDAAINQLLDRCTNELNELFELQSALGRWDELLESRRTTQAQHLLETAQATFSTRDFDFPAVEKALRTLIYAYEEPRTRLNVLQTTWRKLLAGNTLGDRATRLRRWPSVRGQMTLIAATIAKQRKALEPDAGTELETVAESVFSTVESDLRIFEHQWERVLHRDRMVAASVMVIAALIVGAMIVYWAVGAIRYQLDVKAFAAAVRANQIERATALATRVRGTYPPAAQFMFAYGQATAARTEMEKTREAAKTAGAETDAKVLWTGAIGLADSAPAAFDKGDFAESGKTWDAARVEFDKARQSANQARITRLLGAAAMAKSKGDMDAVKTMAEKALSLDPTSAPAKELLVDALGPLLNVTAQLQSKETAGATIVLNGEPLAVPTPAIIKMKMGESYTVRVTLPPKGGTRYTTAEGTFIARRNGEERWCAKIEVYSGPVEGQPWTVPDLGMEFVWIQAMNCWVGKYEVTNGEYRKFQPNHDSGDYRPQFIRGYSLNGERQPVVLVNFFDAKHFVSWLTTREERAARLPTGYSYKLPTSDQWWRIGKCGNDRLYPWGNDWPPTYGNYMDRTSSQVGTTMGQPKYDYDDGFAVSCPVEKSGRSEWGLLGVGGNVCEWTMKRDGSCDISCDISFSQGLAEPSLARLNVKQFSGFVSWSTVEPSDRREDQGFRLVLSK